MKKRDARRQGLHWRQPVIREDGRRKSLEAENQHKKTPFTHIHRQYFHDVHDSQSTTGPQTLELLLTLIAS
jgi:hypothetical protein